MKIIQEDEDETNSLTESQQPPIATEFRQPPTTTTIAVPATRSGIDIVTTTAVTGSLAQSTNHTPRELFQQWQSSTREEEVKPQTQEPIAVVNRIGLSGSDNQHPLNHTSCEPTRPKEEQANQYNVHVSQAMNTQNASDRNPAQIIVCNPDMHKASSNQQAAAAAEQAANRPAGKQLPFAMLVPVIEPHLDRDRAVQLQTLYARFRSNSINKEEFVRNMRTLVGDYMLKMAVYKLQQGQVPATRQNTQRASSSLQSSDASALPADQRPRLLERQSDSNGGQASHASNANVSAINHQQQLQQQHMNLPQPSFPTYGNPGGNFHPSASANMGMPAPSYKQQSHDLQMRQGPVNPAMAPQAMSQHALNDRKRLHGRGHAHFTSNPALQQNSSHWQASKHKDQSLVSSNPYAKSDSADRMNDQQHRSHLSTPHGIEHVTGGPGSSKDDTFEAMSSRCGSITAQLERQNAAVAAAANSSLASGGNAKSPPKKPIVVQKKPLEAPVNPPSKKQKVVGAFADQSIEQLNDVTAVSGVNLKIPVRQYAQSASSSLQSVASTLPADQRPRLLERQSGSHGVKAIHVPNANVSAVNRQRQQQQQQLQLQQPQQHMNFPHLSSPTYGDPMLNSAVYTLQIRADTDASHHYHHHHHHHHYHHHLMDPSQNIARDLDNVLQRTHIMNSNQQGANATNRPSGSQVSFATLLQFLEPQLDKDRNVQLQALFDRLKNNRINREEFIHHMRTLVGDTLWMAMYTLQQGPESR